MKQYTIYFLAFLFVFTSPLSAQNFGDALRYSSFDPIGTARFMGTGSALSALGADFSVMSTNPAGIAWMRKGEFMITPGVFANTTTESRLINDVDKQAYDDAKVQFTLPNIGLVTHSRGGSSVQAINFGIGINRLADFNEQFFFKGKSKGSIVQRFEELANTTGLDDFEAGVAYDAEALLSINDNYVSDFSDQPDIETTKQQSVIRSGSISEFTFGFAVNQDNKLLWGLSIGAPILHYEEEKTYSEEDTGEEVEIFEDLSFTENLTVNGSGINLKLGFIYRVQQSLRLSAAIHTPTYYQLDEQFSTSMVYNYTIDGVALNGSSASPNGEFSYNLRTPWRFLGGVGAIFGKTGFLSGEIEYVNYANNRFLFDGFVEDESILNQGVKDNLEDAIKIKLGGEVAMDNFRIRGGFSTQQAPIVGDESFYNAFSFGIGFRQSKYYVDLGYRRGTQKSTYTPYQVTNGTTQYVDNNFTKENIALTIGFRW